MSRRLWGRLLLVFMVVTMRGLHAFQPPSWYHHHYQARRPQRRQQQQPRLFSLLFMVSQKDKRRRQESADKRQAFADMELARAQSALAVQLKDPKFQSARATKKLLKNAHHDGLDDIGTEARTLALHNFYRANRPVDVIDLLSSSGDDNDELNQLGLWASSQQQDWKSAAMYAHQLYNNNMNNKQSNSAVVPLPSSSLTLFSTPQQQQRLRHWAIRAFAHEGQHLAMAMELLLEELRCLEHDNAISSKASTSKSTPTKDKDVDVTQSINALLQCYLRQKKFETAKKLVNTILQQQQQEIKTHDTATSTNTTSAVSFLDQESFELILECAAQMGDLELLEQGLGDPEAFRQLLEDALVVSDQALQLEHWSHLEDDEEKGEGDEEGEDVFEWTLSGLEFMEQAMGDNNDHREDSQQQAVTHQPSATRVLTLVVETLTKVAATGTSGTNAQGHGQQRLSRDHQILVVQTIRVLQSNGQMIGPNLLSQILLAVDDDLLNTVIRSCWNTKNDNKKTAWYAGLSVAAKTRILSYQLALERLEEYKVGGDAWHMLSSMLVWDRKTGALSAQSRDFFRTQSCGVFCISALYLATLEKQGELQHVILQECVEQIMLQCPDEDLCPTVAYSLRLLPLRDYDLFGQILSIFQQRLGVSNQVEEWPRSYEDAKNSTTLDLMIVRQTVGSLRAFASSSFDDNDGEYKIAIELPATAMQLVSGLDEFSAKHFWDNGGSSEDNRAKEALEIIMKELVSLNLLKQDDDWIYPASAFYFCLARVAQSSSAIDYEDIMFPVSARSLTGASYATDDCYQDFREFILRHERKTKEPAGNLLLDALLTIVKLGDDEGDLAPLLPLILEMTRRSDLRTGGSSLDSFISAYKDSLIESTDALFFDLDLFRGLCEKLDIVATVRAALQKSQDDVVLPGVMVLWTPDVASRMIERLRRKIDAQKWIVNRQEELTERIVASVKFLVPLYAKADCFHKIMMENSESLGKAYLDACGVNCAFLINTCTDTLSASSSSKKKKKTKPRRGRERKKASDGTARWTQVLEIMIVSISQAVGDSEWTPFYGNLVNHALNTFSHCGANLGVTYEHCERSLSRLLSDEPLHPKIQDAIQEWYDAFVEEGKDEGDTGEIK